MIIKYSINCAVVYITKRTYVTFLSYPQQIFRLVKMVLSHSTNKRMKQNEDKSDGKYGPLILPNSSKWSEGHPEMKQRPPWNGLRATPKEVRAQNGSRGPRFPLLVLLISPPPFICEPKKLFHICQHVELWTSPIKKSFKYGRSVFLVLDRSLYVPDLKTTWG